MLTIGSPNGQNIYNSASGDITVTGDINGSSVVCLVSTGGNIHIQGSINGGSLVFLQATAGNITIDGHIEGSSTATLNAGIDVSIGSDIDGATVKIDAGSSITVGSHIHNATVDMTSNDTIAVAAEIDYNAYVRAIAVGGIAISGHLHGSCRVELVSNFGAITIAKDVGKSKAWLTAGLNINISGDLHDTAFVGATSGGTITVTGSVYDSNTVVDLAACTAIAISGNISGGASVRLITSAGSGSITLGGVITDLGTNVTSFPAGALSPTVKNNAQFNQTQWAATDTLCMRQPLKGSWWENWPQTFGYVVPGGTVVPHSLSDLVAAVAGGVSAGVSPVPDATSVKAVGGGWSFTDATLPMQDSASVDRVSIMLRGRPGQQDLQNITHNLSSRAAQPMDLLPIAVGRNAAFSTAYNQATMRQVTTGGAQLPVPSTPIRLIDTRALCSSLQCQLPAIRATPKYPGRGPVQFNVLFHVEAGITIADLQQLLDHQSPRLAFRATGGSPGATLAGTLSTATHGGEFKWPLLVDSVRAIHLVGPGGVEWWIEGDMAVADQGKLQSIYPEIDATHFIGGNWSSSALPGLTAQDVLNAVIVSMGTMGVIYSVVFETVPQYGIQQVVTPTNWSTLLQNAGVTLAQLRSGNATANTAILNFLMDGSLNGTGIAKADNVYVDLAINPINQDCWIVNRHVTQSLPDDSNNSTASDPITALSLIMGRQDNFNNNQLLGRIFDFFGWQTNPMGFASNDINITGADSGPETGPATGLMTFLMSLGSQNMWNLLVGAAAVAGVQVLGNIANQSGQPDRGIAFFGDLLSGFLHAMQGTLPGIDASSTDVAYKVGAIGWPNTGIPGRGLEIALPPTSAFTFLQTVLFDNVFTSTAMQTTPLLGYISIRVCPQTSTLLGMQQFGPFSVMIEVVGYRSPQANTVMDSIQQQAIAFGAQGQAAILHWGLENNLVDALHLASTPFGAIYKGSFTRLSAFSAVRQFLRAGNPPAFDNAFTRRTGL